jgi:hypothetical protein
VFGFCRRRHFRLCTLGASSSHRMDNPMTLRPSIARLADDAPVPHPDSWPARGAPALLDDDANWHYAMPMAKRFLSGRDFEAALELFKERGVSADQLCKRLECGNNQARRWSAIGAPRYIALALTALIAGLPPWRPERTKK